MTFLAIVLSVVFFIISSNRISILEKSLEESRKKGTGPTPVFTPPHPQQSQPKESTEENLGKTLGIIGIFAVLFGIGFFLKYAFDNNLIGVVGRLALGGGVGILALFLGRLFKAKFENYSYILSGGGIGILFVTAYAAHVLYGVISVPASYLLFGVITAVSVVLSMLDGKMLLAAIGVTAGFLAPLLISLGDTEFIGLFSYLFIINVGVAIIAYVYRWLTLHYIAFVGTMISVSSWLHRIPDEDSKFILFAFITLYFLIFLATSIFHHVIRKETSHEGDLMFITLNAVWYSLVSFFILDPLLPEFMGAFMAGLGILYLGLGYISFITHKEDRLLNVALPLIGIAFITVSIPLQLDGSWITTAWLIEAVCLTIIDHVINGKRLYLYAIIVYMIGLVRLFSIDGEFGGLPEDFMPVFNGRCALYAFAVACGLLMAYIIHRAAKEKENSEELHQLPMFLGIITQVVTLFLFTSEIHYYYSTQRLAVEGYEYYSNAHGQENTVIAIVWALYAAFLTVLGFVLHSKPFRIFGVVLFILTAGRIFLGLWALGPIYRVITFIIFGVIALSASFLYARFKDRIKSW
jgi:uncharacterized membrane protein